MRTIRVPLNIPQLLIIFLLLIGLVFIPNSSTLASVELLYFRTAPGINTIVLQWETATEIDNAGFYIQRSLDPVSNFNRISPFIASQGDPFTGYYYEFEDIDIQKGVVYFYILEIVNANGYSEFTLPINGTIPLPTATITNTLQPTDTSEPAFTGTPTPPGAPSQTPTLTLTSLAAPSATRLPPTQTLTPSASSTPTLTLTPTTTLQPIVVAGLNFPALTPTITPVQEYSPTPGITILPDPSPENIFTHSSRIQLLLILTVLLWIVLAISLFIFIRHLGRQ
jgi:hypothetical protein